jgi:hypothetical protein
MRVRYGLRWFQGSMRKAARLGLHAVFASASLLLGIVPASALAQQQLPGARLLAAPSRLQLYPLETRRIRFSKHRLRRGQPGSQAPCWTSAEPPFPAQTSA